MRGAVHRGNTSPAGLYEASREPPLKEMMVKGTFVGERKDKKYCQV